MREGSRDKLKSAIRDVSLGGLPTDADAPAIELPGPFAPAVVAPSGHPASRLREGRSPGSGAGDGDLARQAEDLKAAAASLWQDLASPPGTAIPTSGWLERAGAVRRNARLLVEKLVAAGEPVAGDEQRLDAAALLAAAERVEDRRRREAEERVRRDAASRRFRRLAHVRPTAAAADEAAAREIAAFATEHLNGDAGAAATKAADLLLDVLQGDIEPRVAVRQLRPAWTFSDRVYTALLMEEVEFGSDDRDDAEATPDPEAAVAEGERDEGNAAGDAANVADLPADEPADEPADADARPAAEPVPEEESAADGRRDEVDPEAVPSPPETRSDEPAEAPEAIDQEPQDERGEDSAQPDERTDIRVDEERPAEAEALLREPIAEGREGVLPPGAVWTAMRQQNLALAYQLAACQPWPPTEGDPPALLPEVVLRSLLAGGHRGADALRRAITQLAPDDVPVPAIASSPPAVLVLSLALVRPTLLATTSDAAGLLDRLSLGEFSDALHPLRTAVVEASRRDPMMTPAILKGVQEDGVGDELRVEAAEMLNGFISSKYKPAEHVWMKWLEPGEPVHRLLAPIMDGSHDVDDVEQRLRQPFDVEKQAQHTDKQIRAKVKRKKIVGTPISQLERQVDAARTLLSRWRDLLLTEPERVDSFQLKNAKACRGAVEAAVPAVRRIIDELRGSGDERRVAAAAVAGMLVDELERLFDADAREAEPAPSFEEAASLPLLHLPAVVIGPDGLPSDLGVSAPAEVARLLLPSLEQEPSWGDTFETLVSPEVANHGGARRALAEMLRRGEVDADRFDELEHRAEQELIELRESSLPRERDAAMVAVARAVTEELVDEATRGLLRARVENLEPKEVKDARPFRRTLREVEAELDRRRQEKHAGLREEAKLQSLGGDMADRFEQALASNNLMAAARFLELNRAGQLPHDGEDEAAHEDAFADFFPGFVEAAAEWLGGRQLNREQVFGQIAKQRNVGPLDLRRVSGGQARAAADMLRVWDRLKRAADPEETAALLSDLLTAFGFGVQKAHARRDGEGEARPANAGFGRYAGFGRFAGTTFRRVWFSVKCDRLDSRDQCPLPYFGSNANGLYDVLCVWKAQNVEQIVTEAKAQRTGKPTIVLDLRRMSAAQRLELARLCRADKLALPVVDECLAFYLACVRGSRLPVLFDCAMPFAYNRPYITAAGTLPPEMFYGRGAEADKIWDRNGTSLVYGGRQLGKTALLRHVERMYHRPDDQIVRYLDLKNAGIGEQRPIGDIWSLLVDELKDHRVVDPRQRKHETIRDAVVNWLDADPGRRILLLLDEADRFLEADARGGFVEVGRIRDLMRRTDNRFKVVFAGLHDVQRTTSDPNQPIAQLGEPICVGPMTAEGQGREAAELVSRPLSALGFRFAGSEDAPPYLNPLILLILGYTNHYPKLIQVFCGQLLDHLVRRQVRAKEPPFVITKEDVDEVYLGERTREEIRKQFDITLDLDVRYRVLALLIAYEARTADGGPAAHRGLSASQLREMALAWYPRGFDQVDSNEGFRTLLDEMVGLGVLQRGGENRYMIRSGGNVLNLLGNESEIEEKLVDASEREPVLSYDPQSFRRRHPLAHRDAPPGEPSFHVRRSPLTARQEDELLDRAHGVAVAFGTRLAGLGDVDDYLEKACKDRGFGFVKVADGDGPGDAVARAIHANKDASALVVVGPGTGWTADDVAAAIGRVAARRSDRHFTRVLFLGDATRALAWARTPEVAATLEASPHFRRITLHAWRSHAYEMWRRDVEPHDEAAPAMQAWQGLLTRGLHEITRGNRDDPWPRAEAEYVAGDLPLDVPPALRPALAAWLEHVPEVADRSDLAECAEMIELEVEDAAARLVPAWAELVDWARPTAGGGWAFDDFVASIAEQINDAGSGAAERD